jgi:hypothetical protein
VGLFSRRRVRALDADTFTIRLDDTERAVLADVCEQLREAIEQDDATPALRRLFPMAHASDAEQEAQYQEMVHDDLRTKRLGDLTTLIDGAQATQLDREALEQWMTAINAVRLVFGTTLDVGEDEPDGLDPDDPETPALIVYHFLGALLQDIVEALGETL